MIERPPSSHWWISSASICAAAADLITITISTKTKTKIHRSEFLLAKRRSTLIVWRRCDSFNRSEKQRHNRSYLFLSFTLMRTQLISKTLVTRDDSNSNMINLIVRFFDFICSLNIDVFFYVLFNVRRLFTYLIELLTILLVSLRVSKKKVRRSFFGSSRYRRTTMRFLFSASRISSGQILFVPVTTDLWPWTL